jgi:hypothetical protein
VQPPRRECRRGEEVEGGRWFSGAGPGAALSAVAVGFQR